MATDPSAPPVLDAAPKPRRGCFAFLFKSALGCTAFALGGLIGLVLLLPTLLSGTARSMIGKVFAERFHGQLEIEELELAWFGTQSARNLVLYDPEHKPIAHASASLPSLFELMRSGGTRLGRVVLAVDADLVADDQGLTNLQRALEPRAARGPRPAKSSDDEAFDPVAFLADLDLDLQLTSHRLAWSDAETRRVGIPFVLEDLSATVQARPREPLTVRVNGKVVAATPGALAIDATLHGPIDAALSWPFGKVDARVRIEHFSTAMVDGLANLDGRLKEVLGPTFDFDLRASGATLSTGDIELTLASERSSLHLAGRVADGAFQAAGDPSVVVSIGVPRGFVTSLVGPKLPAGATLELASSTEPWTLAISELHLPLPAANARNAGGVWSALENLRCDVALAIPTAISFENAQLRATRTSAAVSSTRATAHIHPNQPIELHLEAQLLLGEPGTLRVDASVAQAWKALAAGGLPQIDLDARVDGLSTAVIDAFAGGGERVTQAFGPKLSIELHAKDASLDGGTLQLALDSQRTKLECSAHLEHGQVRMSGDEHLRIRSEPPASLIDKELAALLPAGATLAVDAGPIVIELRELSLPVPRASDPAGDPLAPLRGVLSFDLHCALPAISVSNEQTRAAKLPLRLSKLDLAAKMDAKGALTLRVGSPLDTGVPGKLALELQLADAWQLARADVASNPPPVDAQVRIEGLSTAGIDALAAQAGRLSELLGPELTLTLDARQASLKAGSVRLEAHSKTLSLVCNGALENGVLRSAGESALALGLDVSNAIVARELSARLPAGTKLTFDPAPGRVELELRELACTLPDFGAVVQDPAARWLPALESLTCSVELKLPALSYSDASTRAAKLDTRVTRLGLSARVAPKQPCSAKLEAAFEAGGQGTLTAQLALADPWFALRGGEHELPPVDAQADASGMPTALLDALSGKVGLISGLFGPTLALQLRAEQANLARADVAFDVQAQSTTLHAAGRFEHGQISTAPDDGLSLRGVLPSAWVEAQVSPLLPAGARLSVPADAGPFELTLRDIRFTLPRSAATQPDGAATQPDGAATQPNGDATQPKSDTKQPKTDEKQLAPAATGDAAPVSTALKDALELVSQAALRLRLTVPTLVYSDALTAASGKPLTIKDLSAAADFAPQELPAIKLQARIEDEAPAALDVDVRALDPLTALASDAGAHAFRVAAKVKAERVPTSLVDALAHQDGLLLDMLGPRLQLALATDSISVAQGSFTADLASEKANVHCSGRIENGALQIEKTDGTFAKAGLTPLFSERVVGKLVPVLFNVQKPQQQEQVLLAVENLRFPLDMDLSKLDALIHLDLGEISYRLLPGLDSLLGSFSDTRSAKLPPLSIPIKKGVASYDGLPIAIGGREYRFKGTFNLVDQSFRLGTEVPLAALGKKVNDKLESVREYLDPKLMVPIEIRGTWKKPRVSISDDFMKRVVESAAAKGLGGLLEDALGGKKKKKKD